MKKLTAIAAALAVALSTHARATAPSLPAPTYSAIHLQGSGSTGDASAMSVTSGSTTLPLQQWIAQLLAAIGTGSGTGAGAPILTSLSVGTVTSVPPGTNPSVSLQNGVLSFALEQGAAGAIGQSAYQAAVANGFAGTPSQWLASLQGAPGPQGAIGLTGAAGAVGQSAYQAAVANGFSGTQAQWLASLQGATGQQGPAGPAGAAGVAGATGPAGAAGAAGAAGQSAYQAAVANGFSGTQAQWLASLQGATGQQGPAGPAGAAGAAGATGPAGAAGAAGATGQSAYQAAVANGFSGTQAQWLTSLQGATGQQGPAGPAGAAGAAGATGPAGAAGAAGATGQSAYQAAVANGFSGTQAQWLASLQGATGQQGPAGPAGAAGAAGATGPAGAAGAAGATGQSAYQAAVANGFSGTQTQWLASLQGATGQQGPAGAAGATGPAGATGATGPAGPAGPAGSGGAPATTTSAGTVLPDTTNGSTVLGGTASAPQLMAIALAGGSNYASLAGNNSYIYQPSSAGTDENATHVLIAETGVTFGPFGGAGCDFEGKYNSSNASSSTAEWDLALSTSGQIYLGEYPVGSGTAAFPAIGAAPPTGTPITLAVIYNNSTGAYTFGGVSIPSGDGAVFTSTNGGTSWTQLGSLATGLGTAGMNAIGTAAAALHVGCVNNSGTTTSAVVRSFLLLDGNGNVLAAPKIASTNTAGSGTGSIPDSVGAAWTGVAAPVSISGVQTLNPIATATAAGAVLPDPAGSTAIDGVGHLIAKALIAYQAPYTPTIRTLCNRSRDVLSPLDLGANGLGTNSPIGTAYGTTLAAIASYSITDCANVAFQPFSWLLSGNNGGVTWTKQFPSAQDWLELEVNTAPIYGSSTTLNVSNPSGIVAGQSIYDIIGNYSLGTVKSVSGNTVTLNAAIGSTQGSPGGDILVFQDQSTETAAGSTSSPTLTVGNNFSAAAGQGVYDSTQSKQVGIIASISGSTGITLTGNALVAVAVNDNVAIYNPSTISGITYNVHFGQGGQTERAATWQDPSNSTFYPEVGDLISDSNSTPCIPAGDTIASIDSTPTDANYGQITLTVPTAYDCPAFSTYTIRITDQKAQTLSHDWIGLESAANIAQMTATTTLGNTKAMRTVRLPDFGLSPERPFYITGYNSNPGQYPALVGSHTSLLTFSTDFGFGKCAISAGNGNGGVSQYGVNASYEGFEVQGPNEVSQAAGANPSQDVGICMGAGDEAVHLNISGFHAALGLYADHQRVMRLTASNNYYGIWFMPNQPTMGNQNISFSSLVGNFQASIGIAASAQFDSGTIAETHIGMAPYGMVDEAAGPTDPYPGGYDFMSHDTLIDEWWEATAQGVLHDFSGKGSVDQVTFIGAQNGNDVAELSGQTYGTTAPAEFYIAGFTGNKFLGGNMLSDYSHLANAAIQASGTCADNTFVGLDQDNGGTGFVQGATAAKPAMICGSDGGGNSFVGAWNGVFHMAGAVIAKGASVTLGSSGTVVPYNGTNGYLGDAASGGSNAVAGEMMPIVEHGTAVPVEDDSAAMTASLAVGSPIAPTTDGLYGPATGAWNMSNGVATSACGSGQVCSSAELR